MLQRELVHFGQPRGSFCSLEGCEVQVRFALRHAPTCFLVRGRAQREVVVVNEPGAADRPVDQLTLSGIRVEPDSEGLLPDGDRGRFHAQHLLSRSVPATLPAASTAWGHCPFNLSQNQSLSFMSPCRARGAYPRMNSRACAPHRSSYAREPGGLTKVM